MYRSYINVAYQAWNWYAEPLFITLVTSEFVRHYKKTQNMFIPNIHAPSYIDK